MADDRDWIWPSLDDETPEPRLHRGPRPPGSSLKRRDGTAPTNVLPLASHELRVPWTAAFGPRRMQFTMTSWGARHAYQWWW